MALRRRKPAAAWRARREEYLRASGRQRDLVREGFEPGINGTSWSVIRGRTGAFPRLDSDARLFLVSGGIHGGEDRQRSQR
jgi:hypothetical protein